MPNIGVVTWSDRVFLTLAYTWCIHLHMRTNIEINDELLAAAQKYSKAKTKRTLIEEALSTFITVKHEERRRFTYKERLDRLRSKTASLQLRSDIRDIIRNDRESR